MNTALLVNHGKLAVEWSLAALAAKAVALEASGIIARVRDAEEQAIAVAAQQQLCACIKQAEDARKAVKEPVLEYGKRIDAAAKEYRAALEEENLRLSRMIGNFQALEQTKARAAEALRVAELNKIEQERQAALTQAKSLDQVNEINEAANRAAINLPIVTPTRAPGQVVREDWDITVTDIWALLRAFPICVKLEPLKSEIRNLLDGGITPPGVKAERVQKSSVRAVAVKTLELEKA